MPLTWQSLSRVTTFASCLGAGMFVFFYCLTCRNSVFVCMCVCVHKYMYVSRVRTCASCLSACMFVLFLLSDLSREGLHDICLDCVVLIVAIVCLCVCVCEYTYIHVCVTVDNFRFV